MTTEIRTDRNGKEYAIKNGKRIPLAEAKIELGTELMAAGYELDCDVLQVIVLSDWTLRELNLSSYSASDVMNTICKAINDIADSSGQATLVVESQAKPAQVVMPLLLTHQPMVNEVPDYNEVRNGQRGLMQYPEFAFDVLKQIPREFEQGITELPEIPFYERILFEQAQWLREDIVDLDRKSRALVYNYTELASESSEIEEVIDIPIELLYSGMQATPCQLWQAQDQRCVNGRALGQQLKLTTIDELISYAANEVYYRPADSLQNYLLNRSWLEVWLIGNGLNDSYHVKTDNMPNDVVITNILCDTNGNAILDLGTDLQEGINRLVEYFSTDIYVELSALQTMGFVRSEAIEIMVNEGHDKNMVRSVANRVYGENDIVKTHIYNILAEAYSGSQYFDEETAIDVVANSKLLACNSQATRNLITKVAKEFLTLMQPRKQATQCQCATG